MTVDGNTGAGFPKRNGGGGHDEAATPGGGGGAWERHAQAPTVSPGTWGGCEGRRRRTRGCPARPAGEAGFSLFGGWKSLKLTVRGSDKKKAGVFNNDTATLWRDRRHVESCRDGAGDVRA